MGKSTGDMKATTRRLSDTPGGSVAARDWYDKSSSSTGTDQDRQGEEERKTVMQSPQETVARALGGGSRGVFLLFLFLP